MMVPELGGPACCAAPTSIGYPKTSGAPTPSHVYRITLIVATTSWSLLSPVRMVSSRLEGQKLVPI